MSSPATTAGGRPIEMDAQDCVKELLGTSLQLHLCNATGDPIIKAQSEAKAAAAFNLWQVMVSRSCSPGLLYWRVPIDGETLILYPERAAALRALMDMMSIEASRLGFSVALACLDKSGSGSRLGGMYTPPEKGKITRLVDSNGMLLNLHSIEVDFERAIVFCTPENRNAQGSGGLQSPVFSAATGQTQSMVMHMRGYLDQSLTIPQAIVFYTSRTLQFLHLQRALCESNLCILRDLLRARMEERNEALQQRTFEVLSEACHAVLNTYEACAASGISFPQLLKDHGFESSDTIIVACFALRSDPATPGLRGILDAVKITGTEADIAVLADMLQLDQDHRIRDNLPLILSRFGSESERTEAMKSLCMLEQERTTPDRCRTIDQRTASTILFQLLRYKVPGRASDWEYDQKSIKGIRRLVREWNAWPALE